MAGKLIVFEGTDGSGKSTQFQLCCQALTEAGREFRTTVYPRYREESSALVRMYLGGAFGSHPDDVNAYAAPTLLARAGLIPAGARAVCYPGMEGDLVKAGVEPCMTEPFVVEGHLITGRAAGSSFDFGLALLTALSGADVARQVQSGIHYMA